VAVVAGHRDRRRGWWSTWVLALSATILAIGLTGCEPAGFENEQLAAASSARHLGKPVTSSQVRCHGRWIDSEVTPGYRYRYVNCTGPFGLGGSTKTLVLETSVLDDGQLAIYVWWPGELTNGGDPDITYLPLCTFRPSGGAWKANGCVIEEGRAVPPAWR
jgi:hypothetical protein